MNAVSKWLMALTLLSGPVVANAALTSVDGGLGVYDSTNNVTWASDAELFWSQLQAAGKSAAQTTLINAIISDSGGVIHDTPNAFDYPTPYSGIYTLSSNDFNTSNGTMTWWGAKAWVNYLNATNYGGSNQWALPTIVDSSSSSGFPDGASGDPAQSSSQMAELFYGGLGAVAGSPITTTHNSSYALFSNLQNSYFWFGTEYSANPEAVWVFNAVNGIQGGNVGKTNQYYALVVAPGEVNPVIPLARLTALQTQVNGIAPAGLETKATSALKDLEAACTTLAYFVNQVQSQDGKKINPTLDAQLIAEAQAIENAIGCN